MSPSLPELFRCLASFDPPRLDLGGAPWEEYVDWAIAQGLGPLAAYNLEYRLPRANAPDWVKDRLLAVYQGSVNDNVMKLMTLKRAVGELEGRRLVLLGAAAVAEGAYPHVGFRPVIEVRMLVPATDAAPFERWLARAEFRLDPTHSGSERALTDGRTPLFLHTELVGRDDQDAAVFQRAVPIKVLGPSMYRLDLEDAVLAQVVLAARAGFEVPLVEFLDLRELVLGAPAVSGSWHRPVGADVLLERAHAWRQERSLWSAVSILIRLFPEVEEVANALLPSLSFATREVLERAVVGPISTVGRTREFRGQAALRQLLAGS